MKQEVEIEFKNLLTEKEFNRLKSIYFSHSPLPFTQDNYYFDTKDNILRSASCALRIRIKNESAEMTLKTPFQGHHTETNLDLTLEQANNLIEKGHFSVPEDIFNVLKEEGVLITSDVFKIAHLKTERLELEKPHSLIVLDKSFYSDKVDFELEVEADSKSRGEKLFNSILKEHDITRKATETKIARAYKAIH
ncbi:CYTH domain-containing protein [Alkalibacterium kapii]|uniref:Adenylate cyclase n=1 Tax=Alkalibacterium kapii TaxID=426704 RepID=A0A511AY31_9LACT|nr:CYTH domain-containing protein [Alkalibacterium kapii]GEK92051.1 adenylate cyclase [Alkalibacterium kapii]